MIVSARSLAGYLVEIATHGNLTPEQVCRLVQIADRCPVHRTLMSETKIRSRVA